MTKFVTHRGRKYRVVRKGLDRLKWRLATEVSRRIAQGGPMRGRTYFFDTIVANRRPLRESRGMVNRLVLLALEEYEEIVARPVPPRKPGSKRKGTRGRRP